MKKTITLLATAAMFTTASFAQHNQHRDNNYGNDRDRGGVVNNNRDRNDYGNERGTYYFSAREKNMQISSINNDYYRRIESVKNKFFMNRSKKERLICSLEMQREAEIRSVIAKFNDRRNRFDRRDKRDHDYDKRNKW